MKEKDSKIRYFDLLLERAKEREEYIKNLDKYLKIIKNFFKEKLGDVKIFLFGSILRNDFGPNSDIDILVISRNAPENTLDKAKLIVQLRERIGFVNPFEFHIITPEIYRDWYSHFIKEKKEI